jgi:hypothetical protein
MCYKFSVLPSLENTALEMAAFLLVILEVLISNHDSDTDCPDWNFGGLLQGSGQSQEITSNYASSPCFTLFKLN